MGFGSLVHLDCTNRLVHHQAVTSTKEHAIQARSHHEAEISSGSLREALYFLDIDICDVSLLLVAPPHVLSSVLPARYNPSGRLANLQKTSGLAEVSICALRRHHGACEFLIFNFSVRTR